VLNLDQIRYFIDTAYPAAVQGSLRVSSTGDYAGRAFARHDMEGLCGYVAELNAAGRAGIYLRTTTAGVVGSHRRGGVGASAELVGLNGDLDFGDIGHSHDPTAHGGLVLPPDAAAAASIVTEAKLPPPTLWVNSGGGLYPWWLLNQPMCLDEASLPVAATLSAQWQTALAVGARGLGYHYGSVGDLSRVLRLPGTVNRKVADMPRPCVIESNGGPRYSVTDLKGHVEFALGALGVNPLTVRTPGKRRNRTTGDTLFDPPWQPVAPKTGSPFDDFETHIDWAEILEPYGITEVERPYSNDGERHWLRPTIPGRPAPTSPYSMKTGWSADRDWLYVHSTEAAPLPAGETITKGHAHALLYCDGDDKAAATYLRSLGFGYQTPAVVLEGSNLPDSFWDTPVLRHIRQAAQSRLECPDVVFHAMLAQLASYVDPGRRVISGIGSSAASLNYYVLPVGTPSAGKTQGVAIAQELMPVPNGLDMPDAYPIGTGEGVIECYMGTMEKPGAKGKTIKERGQVRHNALFYVDEGAQLNALMSRKDGTVAAVLRSMWGGETAGMQNSDKARARLIRKGSYSFGLIVGYQPDTAADLLNMVGTGLPQRFVWALAADPFLPAVDVEWPGALPWDPATIASNPYGPPTLMHLPDSAKAELKTERRAIRARTLTLDPLDGHRPLMLTKLAGLCALLHSRVGVLAEDWARAKAIWVTSCVVRSQAVEHIRQTGEHAEEKSTERYANREVAKVIAVAQVPHDVERVARGIAGHVHAAGAAGLTNRQIKDKIAGRDAAFRKPAMQACVDRGWACSAGSGLAPGPVRP
jgi:hypothetical protein